ncbi:MAG: CHASE3 domain-containing protein, partial [Burkholderiaceae bacterium]
MKKFVLPKMLISMPLAILAAVLLFFINDTNFDKSTQATAHIEESAQTLSAVNKLLIHLIDAETGQRGYLLTGEADYLEPYTSAIAEINQTLDTLHVLLKSYPDQLVVYNTMARHISRKLAELEITVRMRKEGQEDAWKFVTATNLGKEHMDVIREQVGKLTASTAGRMTQGKGQIQKTLELSRIAIALLALAGLLAFYLYLRQTNVLMETGNREQESLQRERDQVDSLVRERTTNLAQLATHLQNVREDERGALARDLHDELGSLLTAAKLDVARLKARLAVNVPDAA